MYIINNPAIYVTEKNILVVNGSVDDNDNSNWNEYDSFVLVDICNASRKLGANSSPPQGF